MVREIAEYEGYPLFCYAFRPMYCEHDANDGGFTVTLMDNCVVKYVTFDGSKEPRPVKALYFQISPEAVSSCLNEVNRESRWLPEVPLYTTTGNPPMCASKVGVYCCQELIRFDDIQVLANCEFGSARGHYARKMIDLLEEVRSILLEEGLDFDLYRFNWHHGMIRPLPTRSRLFG